MSAVQITKPGHHRQFHTVPSLALLAVAQLIIAIDINIVYVALPEIQRAMAFTPHGLQWVISAYAVAFGGFLLLGGRCADLLGRRRIFIAGLTLYAFSSLIGGLASTSAVLIGARALQGLGGALLFPTTLALINSMFTEGRQRNRALAVWSGAGAAGLSLGSLLGGVFTTLFGWEAVFYINVPLAGGAALLAPLLLPPDGVAKRSRGFDLPGSLAATAGVSLIVFALVQGPESGWTSSTLVITVFCATVLLAVFAVVERRSQDPLIPKRLLYNHSLRTAMTTTFIFGATYLTVPYFLTVYLQNVHGYSPLKTGFAFLIPAVLIAIGTQIGNVVTMRKGVYATIVIGNVTGLFGTIALAWSMTAQVNYTQLIPAITLWAIGQGIAWTAMWIAAASGVDSAEQGVASGVASTAMQVGIAMGLAVLVAISGSGIDGLTGSAMQHRLGEGVRAAVALAALGVGIGVVAALSMARKRRTSAVQPK